MLITRIGSDREVAKEVTTIDVEIGGEEYRITEEHGMLKIHLSDGKIAVIPHCGNEISVKRAW